MGDAASLRRFGGSESLYLDLNEALQDLNERYRLQVCLSSPVIYASSPSESYADNQEPATSPAMALDSSKFWLHSPVGTTVQLFAKCSDLETLN